MPDPTTIDDYLAALTPGRRARLQSVRSLVHAAYSDITERIEWQMPVLARGERVLAMASRAAYMSVYLRSADAVARMRATDPKLKSGKGCLNIPDRAAMPLTALGEVLPDLLG